MAIPEIPGYHLSKLLGEGSYAQVWAGTQDSTGQPVAVKVLGVAGEGLDGEVARLVSVSDHPNVLSVIDASARHEPPYLITPLLAGSLEDAASGTPLPTITRWMTAVAEALQYIHRKGIVHCDLKAANILLDREGLVKVVDFGQAQLEGEENVALGTFWHMPPEQAVIPLDGDTHVIPDVGWDIYALGATFYRILTGRFPREDENLLKSGNVIEKIEAYRKHLTTAPLVPIRQFNSKVDADLSEIVEHCLEIDPHRRYQSAAAVLEDLRRSNTGEPLLCHPNVRGYVLRRTIARFKVPVLLGTALIVVLVAGLVSLWFAKGQIQQQRDQAERENSQLKYDQGLEEISKEDPAGAALLAAALQFAPDDLMRESVIGQLHAIPQQIGMPVRHNVVPQGPDMAADGRFLTIDGKTAVIRPAGTQLYAAAPIKVAVFSPHDDRVAAVDATGRVTVWKGGTQDAAWDAHAATCAFSPDGRILITAGGNTARFWDPAGHAIGSAVTTRTAPVEEVRWLDANRVLIATRQELVVAVPDHGVLVRREVPYWLDLQMRPGRLLLGQENSQAAEYDSASLRPLGTFGDEGNGNVWVAQYSPDGSKVLLGVDDTMDIYDAASRRKVATTGPHAGDVRAAAWAPNGREVACGQSTGQVSLYDCPSSPDNAVQICAAVACNLTVPRQVDDLKFFPHGRTLLVLAADGQVSVWDNLNGYPVLQDVRHPDGVGRAEFSRDGRLVLSQSALKVRVWEAASGHVLLDVVPTDENVQAAHLSPDGTHVVVVTAQGNATVWDVASRKSVASLGLGEVALSECAFSPDGSLVAIGGEDGAARLWDWEHQKVVRTLHDGGNLHSVAFSPDGRRLLIGGEGKHATLWDVADGTRVAVLPHQDWVMQVAFSPDGKLMATASLDATAALWAVPAAAVKEPLQPQRVLPHSDQVWRLAFSPDGSRLATACADFSANLWDVATGRSLSEPMRHKGAVSWVAFSPNGRRLATGSSDQTAQVWLCPGNEASGTAPRPLTPPLRHHDSVNCVAFSPDGHALLTASADGEARLWDIHLNLDLPVSAIQEMASAAAGPNPH